SLILSKYPDTIYAAWIYIKQFQWWNSSQDPSTFLTLLQSPDYPAARLLQSSDGQKIPNGQGGYKMESGKEWVQDLIAQGQPLLTAYGNDAYLGPRIKLNLAFANIAAGRKDFAKSLLQEIAQTKPASNITARAREFVDLIK